MHFRSLACAALALPLSTLFAQSSSVPVRRIGLTAGVNSSKLVGDEDSDGLSRLTGFVGGLSLVLPMTPSFSIQPEALFSMKGVKVSELGITAKIKLNYLEVPVLGRFDIPASGGVKPFVYAGPAIAFKLSCKGEAGSAGVTVSGDCEDEDGDGPKSLDYSGVIGGGLAFDVGGRVLTIGARYTHGFANISNDGEAKNRTISGIVSFEFPWAK